MVTPVSLFGVGVKNHYKFECFEHFHLDGKRCSTPHDQCPEDHISRLKWEDEIHNLVPTVGLNAILDAWLKTGIAAPAWYVFLVNTAGFAAYAAGDTFAIHAGWAEGQPYSNATRPAFTPGAIAGGSVDNSAAKAVFNINASMTVRGGGLCDNAVKATTTGTLSGVGDFTGGSKIVADGDTVNVTVTCTMTSA
jgi:hypothetical protein